MKLGFTFFVLFFANVVLAQNIGIGTTTPDSSSALEIKSTSQGFLPPRMTTIQRNAINNPATGLQIYNTTTDCLEIYAKGRWQNMYCATAIENADTIPSTLSYGLVAYYPFNGNANDESGNGNNGTVNGAILTTDRFGNAGKAYAFDGINNWINVPSATSLNLLGSFSISAWLNANVFNNHNFIVSKNQGVTGEGTWHFGIEQNSSLFQLHYNADPCFCLQTIAANGSNVPVNQWTHVLVTYDSVDHFLKYYMNGILISSFNNFIYNNQITSYDLLIGKESGLNGTVTGYFKGKLDDIAIYNRALTQEEITYLATH